jgi:protein-disulfide isomerase
MNFKRGSIGALLIVSVFWACTKKVSSEPKYIFEKAPKPGLAAQAGDIMVSEDEILQGIRGEIFKKEMEIFELKFGKLKSILLEKMIKKAPNKKGMSNDEYLDKVIAKDVKVSDKEVDKFIAEMKVPKQYITPQYKERVKQHLQMKAKKEAIDKWLMGQAGDKGIKVYLKKPERPFFKVEVGNAPVSTTKKTKVTIVEFSDFQCPHCKKAAEGVVTEIKTKYGDKVKIAFKQYPLPFHNHAKIAAEASLCANAQGSQYFWKMHDAMFSDQSKLAVGDLKATAKKIGLNTEKFNKCLDSHQFASQVDKDIEQGKKVGVQATPTFFVNGQLVSGAQSIAVFSEIIEAEQNK